MCPLAAGPGALINGLLCWLQMGLLAPKTLCPSLRFLKEQPKKAIRERRLLGAFYALHARYGSAIRETKIR
jgi:hypothetical protein